MLEARQETLDRLLSNLDRGFSLPEAVYVSMDCGQWFKFQDKGNKLKPGDQFHDEFHEFMGQVHDRLQNTLATKLERLNNFLDRVSERDFSDSPHHLHFLVDDYKEFRKSITISFKSSLGRHDTKLDRQIKKVNFRIAKIRLKIEQGEAGNDAQWKKGVKTLLSEVQSIIDESAE